MYPYEIGYGFIPLPAWGTGYAELVITGNFGKQARKEENKQSKCMCSEGSWTIKPSKPPVFPEGDRISVFMISALRAGILNANYCSVLPVSGLSIQTDPSIQTHCEPVFTVDGPLCRETGIAIGVFCYLRALRGLQTYIVERQWVNKPTPVGAAMLWANLEVQYQTGEYEKELWLPPVMTIMRMIVMALMRDLGLAHSLSEVIPRIQHRQVGDIDWAVFSQHTPAHELTSVLLRQLDFPPELAIVGPGSAIEAKVTGKAFCIEVGGNSKTCLRNGLQSLLYRDWGKLM
ncbi:hypothetical protein B0H13DRAFT_1854839 [Mycena leptocephala]|nr:hypothetical protein B0H13DRAFT_1854839 [Mycena leptocephala]